VSRALTVSDLSAGYGGRPVLRNVTFEVGWGELVAVIGPNGAGKSTMFKSISGLIPSTGEVAIGDHSCHHTRDRMSAAYIPQRSDLDLGFPVTVGEIVLSGRRRFLRWWQRPGAADRAKALDALDAVDLTGMERRPIGSLSGGQAQRAFLARALAQEAEVFLLDESLSGVDAPAAAGFLGLFRSLCDQGAAILIATHDLALARHRFDRCIAVNGTVVADGPPEIALESRALEATFGSGALAVAAAPSASP
jgi:ABC-type Mn2+/Zn2+ transport system ATPase subunit